MAATIVRYDKTAEPMRTLTAALQMIREGRELLTRARAIMLQYRDGSGASAADYDQLASAAVFVAGDYADANTAAKASFDEIDSLYLKLTTDGSVTGVMTAITQACAKHGV